MTEPARAALAVLRSSANFDWTIVYLMVLTMFIYSGEIIPQVGGLHHRYERLAA